MEILNYVCQKVLLTSYSFNCLFIKAICFLRLWVMVISQQVENSQNTQMLWKCLKCNFMTHLESERCICLSEVRNMTTEDGQLHALPLKSVVFSLAGGLFLAGLCRGKEVELSIVYSFLWANAVTAGSVWESSHEFPQYRYSYLCQLV